MNKLEEKKICAGIVTYNPKIELLIQNIKAIYTQVSCVFIIDNGSEKINEIYSLKNIFPNICFVMNEKNVGIAAALNQIAQKAIQMEFEWFLTLDQDSICPNLMIETYSKYIKEKDIAIISPYIELRILQNNPFEEKQKLEYLETTITSGSLVRVQAWKDVGGFWEYLFIDKVDDDFCYAVRKNGWKILRVNSIILKHEIGNPSIHSFMGKKFYTDSYPSFRYYYIARNTIIIYSLYSDTGYSSWKILLKRGIKIILGENKRMCKLKALCVGIVDGICWKIKCGKRGMSLTKTWKE